MATFPIILPAGTVLVYGMGAETSRTGIVPGNTDLRFGSVYQIAAGSEVFVYGYMSVMFLEKDVICRLATSSTNPYPYTMVKVNNLILTETESVEP